MEARLEHAKPKYSGDSTNDSIFGARREIQRRDPPCTELHERYRTPKNWPEMQKTKATKRVESRKFAVLRRGQEPNFLGFFQ
jgi:hypothetical protein